MEKKNPIRKQTIFLSGPMYYHVETGKKQYYPSDNTARDMCMTVGLQSLCDNTATQLIARQQNKINWKRPQPDIEASVEPVSCILLYKYGSYGSGSHAVYSLPLREELNENNDNAHIFATLFVSNSTLHNGN